MNDIMRFAPKSIPQAGALPQLAVEWLKHLQMRGRSGNTIAAYRADLEQFVGFLSEHYAITLAQTVSRDHIERFTDAQLGGLHNGARTAARKQATVKGLFKYIAGRGIIPEAANPCRGLTPISFAARPVIAPEEQAILAMIDAIPADTAENLRDRAMLRLMYDAALRVGGLCSLDLYDSRAVPACAVRPSGVVTYRAKGGEVRESVCDEVSLRMLDEWCAVRREFAKGDDCPALFLTSRGARMNRALLHARLKHHGARAGLPGIHCHLLRHRRGGEVIAQSGDPRLAQHLLGHKALSTTVNNYGAELSERLRQRIRRDCPVGVIKEVA